MRPSAKRLPLSQVDTLYFAEFCAREADSLRWLLEQYSLHKTTAIYGAEDIVKHAEATFRTIARAAEAFTERSEQAQNAALELEAS